MNKTFRLILIIAAIAISSAIIRTIQEDNLKSTTSTKNESENSNFLNDTSGNSNSNQSVSEQLWFKNPQHGLSFETPHKIVEETFNVPQGTSNYIDNGYAYSFTDNDYGIKYVVLEINAAVKGFDAQAGLNGAVGDFINGWKNGGETHLDLKFSEVKNKYNDKMCDGKFDYMNERMKVKGYCLFKNNIVYTLIGVGKDSEIPNEKLNRTFESIYVIGDKSSMLKNNLQSSDNLNQDKLNTLFAAPNCIKYANSFLGKAKAKIISDYGKDYLSNQTADGWSISYQSKTMKGMNPVTMAFLFTSDDNLCSGIAMYFDKMQLNNVIKFMDNTFEPKEPPPGVVVSFFKAWMQNENENTYVWKLTKTDKLFFLTMKSLKR